MHRPRRRGRVVVVLIAALLAALTASTASAHVTTASGSFRVEMGWGMEPPLTDLDNFVQVGVTDASGVPVAVPAGALSVEVEYGDARAIEQLAPGELAGELRAKLVPTRAGVYTFHVTGTVRGQQLDASATCSEATFECVKERSDAEFPIADPSNGELAERLTRESERVEEATSTANSAKGIAIAALAPAVLALVVALAVGWRSRRGKDEP